MLAEAYTNSRIFDLRMPGAGFAEVKPLTHLRGGSASRESSSLRDAQGRIERHLEAAPGDAHWLQLEARFDILEEKFDPAIDILDRLVAAGPVTANLLLDDASAYFQRGEATGSENDRATALDSLRRADELAPGDTVVLFNEAVVMEDRGQLMNAVETWNRYLRFERDPRWLEEGRRRLQALERKLNQMKSHQSRMDQGLRTPPAMRSIAADSAARQSTLRTCAIRALTAVRLGHFRPESDFSWSMFHSQTPLCNGHPPALPTHGSMKPGPMNGAANSLTCYPAERG
jgi:tetratricopeptide (TPR) repeat protein